MSSPRPVLATATPPSRNRRHRWLPTKEPPASTSAVGLCDMFQPRLRQEALRLLLEKFARRREIFRPPNVHPGSVERIRPRLQPLLKNQVHQVVETERPIVWDQP